MTGVRLRAALFLATTAIVGLSAGSTARAAEFEQFGIESASAEESTSAAGGHPDMTTQIVFNHKEDPELFPGALVSIGRAEDVSIALPPGFVGNPAAFPRCTVGEFEAVNCPTASQVGIVKLLLSGDAESEVFVEPLYNLEPPSRSMVARFGFFALFYPTFVDTSIRSGGDYGVTAKVTGASGQAPTISATTTLWGDPPDPSHDELRLTPIEAFFCDTACFAPGGTRPSGLTPRPFISNPSACEEQPVVFTATSYELPGETFEDEASMPATTNCQAPSFQPSVQVQPTSHQADAPTGLDAIVRIPQTDDVNQPSASTLKDAVVTLPKGMTIASGAADGLAACTPEQVGFGTEGASSCPDAARLGNATFVSPDLPEPLHGAIYQRTPGPGDLFRVWLVSDEFGLHLKIPGEIHADSETGQLTSVFTETPQLPVEEVRLEFKGGPRAPLENPDVCGTYATEYKLTPWSDAAPAIGQSAVKIDEGCAAPGFAPRLSAGVANPVAGAYSPLLVDVVRGDREQNLAGLSVTLPPGELAKLAGVAICPDAAAASGACPAASQLGSVDVAVGAGPQPLWIPQPGKAPTAVYLAGPYEGAPTSIVTRTPAQAGPFDLGTVVVRAAVYVDPETGQVTVRSDPLPQILEGVPLLYRTIHVAIDRAGFAINPTDCKAMAASAAITSSRGTVAEATDRFQLANCASLPYHPKLSIRLEGPTHRGVHPKLIATFTAKPGEANTAFAQVRLPKAAFLDNAHIGTVCTRVQFAAEQCPAASVYGQAEVRTPLLGYPLKGTVYLRSSSHKLPDLVVGFKGPDFQPIKFALAGKTDSVEGALRNTFEAAPDVPVSRFHLELFGGKKGLIELSDGFCAHSRATVRLRGHNGKALASRPVVKSACGRGGRRRR